jgi:hypothetical protein
MRPRLDDSMPALARWKRGIILLLFESTRIPTLNVDSIAKSNYKQTPWTMMKAKLMKWFWRYSI